MAHYQPRKFRRRGNNHTRIVIFNPPVVTYPPIPARAARKPEKTVVTLSKSGKSAPGLSHRGEPPAGGNVLSTSSSGSESIAL